jgi:hypothetical protein
MEKGVIDTLLPQGELPWNSVSHAPLAPLKINGLSLDGNRAEPPLVAQTIVTGREVE